MHSPSSESRVVDWAESSWEKTAPTKKEQESGTADKRHAKESSDDNE